MFATRHRDPVNHSHPVVHHHKRKPTLGDKLSGALTRLRGSLTRRPGLKVRPCLLCLGSS